MATAKDRMNALVRKMRSAKGIIIMIIVLIVVVLLVGLGVFVHHRNKNAQKPVFFHTPHKAEGETTLPGGSLIPVGDVYAFTYHMFVYIKDYKYRYGFEKEIMSKGDGDQVCPSLHLSPKINDICIRINTLRGVEKHFIRNVNVRKWCHIGVCVHEQEMDLYVDGKLQSTIVLKSVCQVNSDDLYVTKNGGFSGLIFQLSYLPLAVTPADMAKFASVKPPVKASYFSRD